jgi:hypothetical protein
VTGEWQSHQKAPTHPAPPGRSKVSPNPAPGGDRGTREAKGGRVERRGGSDCERPKILRNGYAPFRYHSPFSALPRQGHPSFSVRSSSPSLLPRGEAGRAQGVVGADPMRWRGRQDRRGIGRRVGGWGVGLRCQYIRTVPKGRETRPVRLRSLSNSIQFLMGSSSFGLQRFSDSRDCLSFRHPL